MVLTSAAGDLHSLLLCPRRHRAWNGLWCPLTTLVAIAMTTIRVIVAAAACKASGLLDCGNARVMLDGSAFDDISGGVFIMIAATAGWLGLSLAIGARRSGRLLNRDLLFAGLGARSNDLCVSVASSLVAGIELQSVTAALKGAFGARLARLADIFRDRSGAVPPARLITGSTSPLLVGASKLPRTAEHERSAGVLTRTV